MDKTVRFAFTFIFIILMSVSVQAQSFDFERLEKEFVRYSVIIDMNIEYSFGIHNNEQSERYLGTVVSEDGLVMFNGTSLSSENSIAAMTGVNVKSSAKSITVTFFDGKEYTADFIGADRFTNIGFLRLNSDDEKFPFIKFRSGNNLKVGDWVSLYMLMPEFINPQYSADIGMVSSIIETPENFHLIVGFNALQMTSVIFDGNLNPIGVLGRLNDPSQSTIDPSGMLDSFNSFGMPLLGIITADRLEKMIADPPQKGKSDRGWLGITLQALTKEMAEFWRLDLEGGIIVNDIVNNSPAFKSGLQVGDILYKVNDQPVTVSKEEEISIFQRKIAEMGPGASVEFSVIRNNEELIDSLKLIAVLEDSPMTATDAPEYDNTELEFKAREMVFADFLFNNLDDETFTGVVVSELKSGGLAQIEGLEIGDIIQRVGDATIENIDDLETVLTEAYDDKQDEIIFFIWRNQKTLFVNIKTEW
ncbi:MAG: PDZ domain-containing protein [Calditrichaeota bacterium]|nr:MAG: PDZ domain-containing protein [Calditrichota bacterium]